MSTIPRVEFGHRRHRIGTAGMHAILRTRSLLVGAGVVAALVVTSVLSLMTGDFSLEAGEVIAVFRGAGEGLAPTVVLEWRLPRVLAAVVLGAALAVSGALFQTLTRNPLASPDILGLSSGAFTGMLLTVLLLGTSWLLVTAGSVLGGAVAGALIYLLALRDGIEGFRFIVVGIAISAMLASANTWMLLQIEVETAMFASAWGAGSLNGVTGPQVLGAGVCVAVLLAACAVLAPGLRQLDLGDDAAAALGLRPGRVQATAVLLGVALVCVATAVVGPVAFIALAAPQIARRAAGTPYLPLTLSALLGGWLLLVSDFVAQHLLPVTLPAGVVTVVLGGAFLVWMIVRELRR
ncbi:iron chelate uptake ABC transporter family permease subunit [Nocardioides carbamazepini]|uniref:FecCD family ABC transporter permease n=1 Tax=Nocardioides carbamazepini TaxID=2854259 RepID=UPI00214A0D7F|nr:iron chelate uptake ABC transporter family permease subunit [Nocardioides carbamazepini]MCR1781223.1 iron chelate uptake ABC transporter family permease subunit [Nocardioides carbamazepini]